MHEVLPSPSFCVLPWIHVFADELGELYPCCRSVGSRQPNVVDDGGPPYKLHSPGGLEGGWNSAYMRRIRLAMLTGDRPKACERCYMYDDLQMESHRAVENRRYGPRLLEILSQTAPDGSTPLSILSADIRLGNRCNLGCRMCTPQSSKMLIEPWARIHGVPVDHPYFENLRRLDWVSRPDFWERLEQHTGRLERLHLAGGEPLLIPQVFDFLERLIAQGRAKDLALSFTSNLTVMPRRVRELWPRFGSVRVTVSLDGYGAVNSLIRPPSRWAVVSGNLAALDAEADELNCTGGVAVNTAVQALNVLRLDELLEYLATSFQRVEAPSLSILTYPTHYSVRVLSPSLKAQAEARLRSFTKRFAQRWPARWRGEPLERLLRSIDGITEHMAASDGQEEVPEFCRWTEHQDEVWGRRARDVVPELGQLFESEDTVSLGGT